LTWALVFLEYVDQARQ